MNIFLAILGTMLGSAGLFSMIQFLISRHDKKNDKLGKFADELNALRNGQKDMNVRLTRMELMGLIRNNPENTDAILQVAEYYFIQLHGNAYAHAMFEKWAKEHNVAIGWLPKIRKGVKKWKKSKSKKSSWQV
jgi:hypothetical protein